MQLPVALSQLTNLRLIDLSRNATLTALPDIIANFPVSLPWPRACHMAGETPVSCPTCLVPTLAHKVWLACLTALLLSTMQHSETGVMYVMSCLGAGGLFGPA